MRALLLSLLPLLLSACSKTPSVEEGAGAHLLTGPVLEQLDAPPYTYLRVKTSTGEVWAAVPVTGAVDSEKPVAIRSSGAFKNFYASPAARRFEVLYVGTLEPTPGK